ncbi:MAG: type I glyceraldehyde-3-phosphate dehydrogenase [Thermoplasmata archaeon]|nr:type I glyceraldehyde-3-phosphate dehydrogenase [Thermoplasmatales archaeon]PMP75249.1 MAG: type I glyceraldehyde-3-phosphate dehydrogenase [Aciduliprofundum sp.]HEU12900.1 type I glyceraldehyde-3-phosphate dehydrogenase [Euryarchaeota archaeon]
MVRVAINGFGRIGRLTYRIALERRDIELVAVNDLVDAKSLAHLLKYDSNYGTLNADVKSGENYFEVNGKRTHTFSEKDPSKLPWKDLDIDIVVESTGQFTDGQKAIAHINAGAKKVIISAPAKNEDFTVVLGVNEEKYDPKKHRIISNGSCTTNCITPIVKVINDEFGIEKSFMNTVHSVTMDQRLQDAPHKDFRRMRAASQSIIPTSTGAAKSVAVVIPEMKGKFEAISMRVPTSTVSVVDFVALVKKSTTKEEILKAFEKYANGRMKGILGISYEPLVSIDFKGTTYSAVVDAELIQVNGENLIKVVAWYDNEYGYACRLVDLIEYIQQKGI